MQSEERTSRQNADVNLDTFVLLSEADANRVKIFAPEIRIALHKICIPLCLAHRHELQRRFEIGFKKTQRTHGGVNSPEAFDLNALEQAAQLCFRCGVDRDG